MSTDPQGPRPMPRQDLSAFTTTPRGVAANRLPSRRRTAAPEAPTTEAPATEEAPPVGETAEPDQPAEDAAVAPGRSVPPAPASAPAGPRRPRTPTTAAPAKRQPAARTQTRPAGQIIVYLKDDVADRLRAAAQQSGRTHLQLIADAIDATHQQLPDFLEAAGYIDRPTTSLFADAMHGVRRRPSRTRKTQIGLRPPVAVLEVIDQLVIDCAAPNRSALVEVALDHHLPPASTPPATRRLSDG